MGGHHQYTRINGDIFSDIHAKALKYCSWYCEDFSCHNNIVEFDPCWFHYDKQMEQANMKQRHNKFKHLNEKLFLFTILYYPPMMKYLFSIVTASYQSKIISKVFSSKMNGKWKHYQNILFQESAQNQEEDIYYFKCGNNKCRFSLEEDKSGGNNNSHIIYVNGMTGNPLFPDHHLLLVAIQYDKWYKENIVHSSLTR